MTATTGQSHLFDALVSRAGTETLPAGNGAGAKARALVGELHEGVPSQAVEQGARLAGASSNEQENP
jgi:hypothetical protein